MRSWNPVLDPRENRRMTRAPNPGRRDLHEDFLDLQQRRLRQRLAGWEFFLQSLAQLAAGKRTGVEQLHPGLVHGFDVIVAEPPIAEGALPHAIEGWLHERPHADQIVHRVQVQGGAEAGCPHQGAFDDQLRQILVPETRKT